MLSLNKNMVFPCLYRLLSLYKFGNIYQALTEYNLLQLEDDDKPLLLQEIEKMVPAYRQLQVTAKAHVQGKSATFTKVSYFNKIFNKALLWDT